MLNQIPCHLIGGPLGAGKTSLLQALLAEKPADEHWALLINEFGAIGLDAALLARDEPSISLHEVAGGCLCCVNGAPFQVGLSRLLRQAKPQRVLIETSGLGHPLNIAQQLQQAPWQQVLQLQPLLMVLDAQALKAGQQLSLEQYQGAEQAGLLLLNKSAALSPAQRQQILAKLPARPVFWTDYGKLPFSALPRSLSPLSAATTLPDIRGAQALGHLWHDPTQPLCDIQHQPDGWAIGWRWHPSQVFSPALIQQWLNGLGWQRAKAIMQQPEGALALNALSGQALHWQPHAWRRDSRLELIFSAAQDAQALQQGLQACRQTI